MTAGKVDVSPTKRFFVQMLTRDVTLEDAILDLLDNCVDGIIRQRKHPKDASRPYAGYWARIKASPRHFEITDNCGGIPKDVAENSAFRLGRPDGERDADLKTVGMYGIGMKRAIFKMGRECVVTSQVNGKAYEVKISPEWLEENDEWHLKLRSIPKALDEDGTKIEISKLREQIGSNFNQNSSNFLTDLGEQISSFFALIIQKGFAVYLNDNPIKPVDILLLMQAAESIRRGPAIAPYIFRGRFQGVTMLMSVGFYRSLAGEKELDDERRVVGSSEHAGWTIVCNDRVILHADKSSKTGWGLSNVPRYHNQFISICGVVTLESKHSDRLPLTTNKRGLDTTSDIYVFMLNQMMDGMKKFTDFTNAWKAREEETSQSFAAAKKISPARVVDLVPTKDWKKVSKLPYGAMGEKFVPDLPKPLKATLERRISFVRLATEIEEVSAYLFDDDDVEPKEVGERCFDDVLKKARK